MLPLIGPGRPVRADAVRDTGRGAQDGLEDIPRVAANAPDTVVIADCGRIDAGSPAMPLVRSADAMILLTLTAEIRCSRTGTWGAHGPVVAVSCQKRV